MKFLVKRFVKFSSLMAFVLTLIGIFSGCNLPPNENTNLSNTAYVSNNHLAEPIKVAGLTDVTGTAPQTRTKQLTVEDFMPVINRLKKTGGELGVGLINEKSDKPLLRLRIEIPPVEPAKPTEEGDVDALAEQMDKYQSEKQDFDKRFSEWKTETNNQTELFLIELKRLLDRPPTAQRSAVSAAIERGDLFLSENDPDFPKETTKKFILLNSDCQNNVGKSRVQLKSKAQIIVVNGVGSLGYLANLEPKPDLYESFDGAVRIITKGGK